MKLTDVIGHTPLIEFNTLLSNPGVRLFGKLEGNNPGSSVKDRAAFWMIRGAEERGDLKPGVRIIEPTSGNTGIALAMIARQRGYDIDLVMPESATRERVQTMRAFGARVILTPAADEMEGAIDYARKSSAGAGYIMLDQFSNPDNPRAHYESTGPEIWKDTMGGVTHFVSSMGTTGTIMGVSRYLKEQNPEIQIIGVQPTEGSSIPGIRRWPKAYLPRIYEPSRVERIIDVSREDAMAMSRRLARDEGVFCGMSAGGAVSAAVQLGNTLNSGIIVTIVCDRGDRYLSSDLFESPEPEE